MFPMSGVGFMGRRQSGPITSGLLTLEFDDILNAPVANPYDVADWNTHFNLPTSGTEFTSVTVTGDIVELFGGIGIDLRGSVFGTTASDQTNLLSFVDTDCIVSMNAAGAQFARQKNFTNCVLPTVTNIALSSFQLSALNIADFPQVIATSTNSFRQCVSLTNVVMPLCETIGNSCFRDCPLLLSYTLPAVTFIDQLAFYNSKFASANFPLCVTVSNAAFQSAANDTTLTSINLPSCTTVTGTAVFWRRRGVTSINLAACTQLGATTDNDNIFFNITGNTITFTLPVGTRTDGDAVALAAANTVTFLP